MAYSEAYLKKLGYAVGNWRGLPGGGLAGSLGQPYAAWPGLAGTIWMLIYSKNQYIKIFLYDVHMLMLLHSLPMLMISCWQGEGRMQVSREHAHMNPNNVEATIANIVQSELAFHMKGWSRHTDSSTIAPPASTTYSLTEEFSIEPANLSYIGRKGRKVTIKSLALLADIIVTSPEQELYSTGLLPKSAFAHYHEYTKCRASLTGSNYAHVTAFNQCSIGGLTFRSYELDASRKTTASYFLPKLKAILRVIGPKKLGELIHSININLTLKPSTNCLQE